MAIKRRASARRFCCITKTTRLSRGFRYTRKNAYSYIIVATSVLLFVYIASLSYKSAYIIVLLDT